MSGTPQLVSLQGGFVFEDFGETPKDLPRDLTKYGARLGIIWPVIDVARSADVPIDYPGPMAVPITFVDRIHKNDGQSGWLIVGKVHHGILENGKKPYQKLLVINIALRARITGGTPAAQEGGAA